jgi:hypothetical protein
MTMIRFTPCGCERSRYRLLPRKWWMRLIFARRRYRCGTCKATMLLRDGRMSRKQRLVVVLAIALAAWGSLWFVGYTEEARDAAWKRSVAE